MFYFFTANSSRDKLHSSCKECCGYKFSKPKPKTKEGYKICTKCGKELMATVEYFYKSPSKDGLRNECKKCAIKEATKRNIVNIDAIVERRKKHWVGNRDSETERYKKWLEAKPKEYQVDRSRKYYQINKERENKRSSEYRKSHKDRVNTMNQTRKAIKSQLPSTLTAEQWEAIKKYFGDKCAYCGCDKTLTQEHFVPLSKGGEYTHNNIIPVCKSCNSSKHDKSFFTWYPTFKHYSPERESKILTYLGYENGIQQLSLI